MTLFTRSLWPDSVANPYRKLGIAMIAAPLAVLVLLSLGAFLIAGMMQPTQADAVASTLEVIPMLAVSLFGFMATLGAIGVAVLWAVEQRGVLVWALTGALMGALAGIGLGFAMQSGPNRVILLACAFLGWILFLLVRRFARIQPPEFRRSQSDSG